MTREIRFDKIIRLEEGNELKQVVVQMPGGIKIYNCSEASMDDYLALLGSETNEK